MSLNIVQFREQVVRPVLWHLDPIIPHTMAAENLLMGTAAQESGLKHLKQIGGGPALGIYQCEPATHDDIWRNFLKYRDWIVNQGKRYMVGWPSPSVEELTWNLAYATFICRVHYFRVASLLPAYNDIPGLAKYWKLHYNTPLGKGAWEDFAANYEMVRLPVA